MENEYIQLENKLKELLNSTYNPTLAKEFKEILGQFKNLGFSLSSKFLRGLMEGLTEDQKKKRVSYIVKLSKCNIHKSTRLIRGWTYQNSLENITIYKHDEEGGTYVYQSSEDEKLNKTGTKIKPIGVGKSFIQQTSEVLNFIQ